MVAELDCIVDDREDAASKPFEQVRLKADAQERIGKIPEGPDRDKAIEAEKKLARESLLEKADEAARKAGHESYMAMLEKELKPSELEVAKERIADGKVSDATALFQAGDTSVGNLGKDSGKFYEVMQDKTPDQMNDLRKDFQAKHPDLDFDEWVRSKATSDGQKRDFEIMLEGNYARMAPDKLAEKAADPDGQRALIKRVKDLEEAARGGASDREYDPIGNAKRKVGNAIGNELADTIGNAGDRLDGRVEAVTKLEAKLDAGETLSSEEQEELVTHMRYMAGDQKAYTDTKTSAVNVGAEVVGTVVEVGTVALTGNDTLATAAGGLAKMEVKGTFDPGRFGADEMVAEGIGILADTAGSALGGKFKTPGVGEFAEGALGGLGSELGNTQNWNDPGKLLDASMRSAATQGTSAVLSAGAEAVVGEGLAGKLATATVEELATGDESQTFKQRFTNVAKSAAQDMASGAASSHHQKHHGNSDAPSSTPPASEAPAHEKQSHEKPSVETPAHETPAHEKPSVETPSHETPAPQTPAHERNPLDASEPSSDPKKKGPETIDDLAAQSPDLRSANPKDLATAKTKLATGDALDSREMQAVLDLAVNAARQAVERDGFSIDNKELGGLCGPMQHQVTQVLQHVLGDGAQVVTHASHHARAGEEAGSARGLPGKLQSTDTDHSYTTIHMPDGRAFLVDPSFGQFANPTAAVGNRLLAENGGEMGAALMKNGFIELTPEAANAYGRALTGKDTEFTVDDFAESSRNPALSPEKLRDKSAIADAKQLWDSVFEIKDVGSDEPPVSDPTPSTGDVSIHPIVSVYGVPDMTPDPNVDLSPVDLKAMNETDRAAEAADVEKARREMRTPAQKVGDASSAGVGVVDKFLTKVFGINDTAVLEGATAKGAPTNDANDAVKTGGDAYTVAKALANLVRPRDKQDASAIGDGVITGLGLGAQALADAFMPGAGQVVGGMIDGAKPTLDQADTKSGVGNALRALLGGNLASAGDHITAAVQVLLPGVNFAHKSNDEKAHRDEVNARTKELVEAGMPPYEARVEARRERLDSINDLPGQDHRHLDLDADVTGEEPLRSPAQEKRIEDIQRQEQALASARVELRLAKGDPEMEAQIQQDIARYEGELGKLRVQPEDTDGVIDLSTPGGRARKEEMARQQAHLASLRAQLSLAMKQDDPVAARGIKNQIDSAEIRSRELAAVDAGSGETFATRIDIGSAEDEVEQLRVRVFDAPPEEQLALNQQIEAEENRVRALREQLAEQEALQAEAEARALERRRA